MSRVGRPPRPVAERLWGKVEKTETCWLWHGAKNRSGYGRIQIAVGVTQFAHRVAYGLVVGPIPEGMTLDHLCRVPACVRPSHLEPVTARENVLRGRTIVAANITKTHCVNGHEYTPENTYRFGPERRYRACVECRRRNQSGIPKRVTPFRHRPRVTATR